MDSAVVTGASGATGAGGGATGRAGATGSRKRDIGGRKVRFAPPSVSTRFGFGFFSSINETVSDRGVADTLFGASTGLAGVSTRRFEANSTRGFSGGAGWDFGAGGAMASFAFAGLEVASELENVGGGSACALALLASFFFNSGWDVLRDDAAALAGLRAVAVLRTAVVLLVVFVAIKKFLKCGHGRFAAHRCYGAAGVS